MTEFQTLFEAEIPTLRGTLFGGHPLLWSWYAAEWNKGGEAAVKAFTQHLLTEHAKWQHALEGG